MVFWLEGGFMRILVTGLGGPAGTNVVNYIPEGLAVAACDADPRKRSELSRIGKAGMKFFTVPHASNKDAFKMAINQIVIRYNIDTVIPTVDEELMVLSYRPEHIDARVVVSPYATIRTCNDKALLYGELEREPFCPRFMVTERKEELSSFGSGPVFMKPRVGRGSRGTRTFRDYTEIPRELVTKENVFCEYLQGQEYTVDCLFDMEGSPVVIVPRKRVEVLKGISIRGETRKHPEIEDNVKKISGILRFTGPVNIQFKQDQSGVMKLVEINPRFSGGLPITAEAGANLPELLCRMLSGEKVREPGWREGTFENRMLSRQERESTT
jgi:carbamoyl-phosphate synthase large subunit